MNAKTIAIATTAALAAITLVTCTPPPVTAPSPSVEQMGRVIQRDVAFIDSNTVVMRFNPPPIYAYWRAQIEECSGLHRQGEITYFVGPDRELRAPQKKGRLAMYISGHGRIVFGIGQETVDYIVRHEDLHFELEPILPPAPENETQEQQAVRLHPAEYFEGKCRDLVNPPSQAPSSGGSRGGSPRAQRDGTTVRNRYS